MPENNAKTELSDSDLSAKLGTAGSHAILMLVLYTCDRFDFIPRLIQLGHPATAQEIAEKLGLTQRYVSELCNCLSCHSILLYNADSQTYSVPKATAVVLGSDLNSNSYDGVSQAIHSLHGVADRVADSIQGKSKGVPFTAFDGIIEAIMRMNRPAIVTGEVFTWTKPLQAQLERGICWVDVGCGSGQLSLQLAERYPASQFLGIDLSAESIAACQASLEAISPPLTNISYKVMPIESLAALDLPGGIDVLSTFDVIHDVPHSTQALKAIYNALKPDGQYFMVEPKMSSKVEENLGDRGGFLYGISLMHCLTQNLANEGEGLGAAWGHQRQEEMLREAGFSQIQRLEPDNETQIFWLSRK
jgi:2-polyprenyl-3-methyl-5-hydroxy-6-metoxy-1,4-benzoquinol methylase